MSLLLLLAAVAVPCSGDAIARVLLVRRDVRGGERWSLAVPVVGAIAIAVHRGVPAKRRAAALLAGLAAAYLVTAGLVAAIALVTGVRSGRLVTVVDSTERAAPADGVLVAGDRILTLDGEPVDAGAGSLAAELNRRGGRAIELGIERGGAARSVTVTPRRGDDGRFRIGVRLRAEDVREPAGLVASLAAGFRIPLSQARAIAIGYVDEVVGARDAEVRGPVGIAERVRAVDPDDGSDTAVRWACWTLFHLALFAIICSAAVATRPSV